MTAARFDRKITATRARISMIQRQTLAHPFFELLNGNCSQGDRTCAETSQRCFAVNLRDLFCEMDHALGNVDGLRALDLGRDRAHKTRAAADESDEAGITVFGH